MVTYYNKKDLVSFGQYLFSDRRNQLIINEDSRHQVTHADIENWKEEQKNHPVGPSVDNRITTTNTETINYIPNEKCERQCEEDKKRMEKEYRYQMMLKYLLKC